MNKLTAIETLKRYADPLAPNPVSRDQAMSAALSLESVALFEQMGRIAREQEILDRMVNQHESDLRYSRQL